MAGRPTAAATRAAKWLAAELAAGRAPTPPMLAQRTGLSVRQARRICAQAGIEPQPVGRPRAPGAAP